MTALQTLASLGRHLCCTQWQTAFQGWLSLQCVLKLQNKTIFPKVTITVTFFKRKIFVSKCHCKDLFQKKKWEKIAKIKFLWLIPWKKVVYFYHLGILCWKHQAMSWFQYEYRSRDSQSHVRMTIGVHGFACWLLGYMGLLVYLIWSVRRLGYAV